MKKYRNEHWGCFEHDPASPLLDMGSGKAWDRAVEIEEARVRHQQEARIPHPPPPPKPTTTR